MTVNGLNQDFRCKVSYFFSSTYKDCPIILYAGTYFPLFRRKRESGATTKGRPAQDYLNCNMLQQKRVRLLDSYALAVDDIYATTLHLADLAATEVEDLSVAFS